jgi:hypothetical protein
MMKCGVRVGMKHQKFTGTDEIGWGNIQQSTRKGGADGMQGWVGAEARTR